MFFVDYCSYGMKYRKRTVLWSNVDLKLELCKKKGKCPGMINNRHIYNIGNNSKLYKSVNNAYEKSKIPDLLIDEIIKQIT